MPKPLNGDEEIRTNDLVRVIKQEGVPKGERLKDIPPTPQNYKKFKGENRRRLPRGIAWGIAGLVIFFVAGFVVSFFLAKGNATGLISSQIGTLQAGIIDLQNLDPQSAEEKFSSLSTTTTPSLGNIMGLFGFLFKDGNVAITSFSDLTQQLASLSQEITGLESGVFDFATSGQGGSFISGLTNLRDTLAVVDGDMNQLSGVMSSASAMTAFGDGNFYLPLKTQIDGAENFLTVFIPWLSSPVSHHVLVLLENPSEIRPGGGFLGSYADVTIANGNIVDIAVHDIADVDAGFKKNIIPPQPLQLETPKFRPADANWFFDFPTSASETIQFFEQSNLYAGTTTFDGAIAVSPKVISDLLTLTGPVTVQATSTGQKAASTTFTSSNFLVQVQNIVQLGQAKAVSGQATYPKAILGQLSQAIFEKLASSTDSQKQQLLSMALDWAVKKDAMVYFKNPAFENFFAGYGATGDVYQMPQDFNGDYLAVVDANINGDKSDLYVTQKISLESQINADGTITDNLLINHTHTGNTSPYWWYQTANQDYLQVFVPDASSLTNEAGGVKKSVKAPLNYAKNGYSTDPMVAAIESSTQPLFIYPAVTTHEEDGKEVFATWAVVAKGQSTELEFDYTHRAFILPKDGVAYQFIFEKQAGSSRNYDITVDAPLGYVFAENNLASYEYKSNDPPGRLTINLTLQKI